MTFAAPAFLWLLAALPIVVLLHLRRRRPVDVGSLHVWKRVEPPTQRTVQMRTRPPISLALLLQLLVVALLALAAAGPSLGSDDDAKVRTVVLLDASDTMLRRDGPTARFERARERVLETWPPDGSEGLVDVVRVDDRPAALHAGRAPDEAFARRLASLEARPVLADWASAARVAAGLLAGDATTQNTRWVVVTAPEAAADAVRDVRSVVPDADLHLASFGSDDAPNAGLVNVRAERRAEASGSWTVRGNLETRDVEPDEVRIVAHYRPFDTERFLSWATLDVVPDGSGSTEFELAIDVPGDGVLELRLPDGADAYEWDDHAPVVLSDHDPVRVLIVGADSPTWDRAFLSLPGVVLFRSENLPPDADAYDLVVLSEPDPIDVPRTSVLLLAAAPDADDPTVLEVASVTSWRSDHPLTPGFDPTELTIDRATVGPVLPGADVLAASGDTPLIQTRTADTGVQTVLAFAPTDTDWPAHTSFPSFVAAIVDAATPDRDLTDPQPCTVGRPCPLPPAAFAPEWTLLGPDGAEVVAASGFVPTDDDPLGASGTWRSGVLASAFVPDRPGLYVLRSRDDAAPTPIAVQGRTPPASVPAVAADVPEWSGGPSATNGVSSGRWLALAATILLLIEVLRSGLGRERFLRRDAWIRSHHRPKSAAIVLGSATVALLGALAAAGIVGPTLIDRDVRVAVVEGQELPEAYSRSVRIVGDAGDSAATAATGPTARDLEEAVATASAALPDRERKIVELPNSGSDRLGVESFRRLNAYLVEHDVVLMGRTTTAEERDGPNVPTDPEITGVHMPRPLRAGDTVDVHVSLSHHEPDRAYEISVAWNEQDPTSTTWDAGPRLATVATNLPDEAGPHAFRIDVRDATDDAVVSSARTTVHVDEPTRLLILSDHTDAAAVFAERLRIQNLDVDVDLPRRTPPNLDRLSDYDVVLLLDVPAIALHTVHQELLSEWVRTRGGGLIVAGGENAFGAGGYFRTELEELSPLSARIPEELPEATLVFVLDRSGSMQALVGPVTRLDIAKEATVSAFELLDPASRVGIVAFDAEAETIADLRSLADPVPLEAAVASLQAGGGTAIHPALVHARDMLEGDDATTKHVIVFTDGLSQPGDFETVLGELRAMGATTSFIGIGDGADQSQLMHLANLGGGQFHMTRDFQALPGILAQETMNLSTDPIERTPLATRWSSPLPAFARSVAGDPPSLGGYVRTTAKDEASVHLAGDGGDVPILASWRFGLGRVVGFASQPIGPWASEWAVSEEMTALWPQTIRWTSGTVRRAGIFVDASADGAALSVVAQVRDTDAERVAGLHLVVDALADDGDTVLATRRLHEASTGRYETTLHLPGDPRDVALRVRTAQDAAASWLSPVERTLRHPPPVPLTLTSAPLGDATPRLSDLTSFVSEDALPPRPWWQLPWTIAWSAGPTFWVVLALFLFVATLGSRYLTATHRTAARRADRSVR